MEFPARRFRNLRPPLELAQLSSLPFVFAFPEVDARPPIRCSRKGGWLYEFPLALLSQERQSGIPLTVGAGRLAAFGTRLRRLGLRSFEKYSYTRDLHSFPTRRSSDCRGWPTETSGRSSS